MTLYILSYNNIYIEDNEKTLQLNDFHILDLVRLRSLCRRYFFVELQYIRHRSNRSDRKLVDLLVALRVMVLDVSKLGRASESFVIPVQISDPSIPY